MLPPPPPKKKIQNMANPAPTHQPHAPRWIWWPRSAPAQAARRLPVGTQVSHALLTRLVFHAPTPLIKEA